jgi:hypothetical protein
MSGIGVDRASVSTLSAKASAEPLRFNATERSAYIRTHVQQIIRMISEGRSKKDIQDIFPVFAEEYPGLLEMLLRPNGFDEKSLSLMITMLETMGNGKASQHEASIKVGQYLLNSYVKPNLS